MLPERAFDKVAPWQVGGPLRSIYVRIVAWLASCARAAPSLALLAGVFALPVQAETNWESLSGTWRGLGQIREDPLGVSESGACKFKAVVSNAGAELSLQGRCANTALSARVSTMLRRNVTNGAISGVSKSSNISETIELSGQEANREIRLRSANTITQRGQSYRMAVRIRLADDMRSFWMVQTATNTRSGQETTVLDMRFAKQQYGHCALRSRTSLCGPSPGYAECWLLGRFRHAFPPYELLRSSVADKAVS